MLSVKGAQVRPGADAPEHLAVAVGERLEPRKICPRRYFDDHILFDADRFLLTPHLVRLYQ